QCSWGRERGISVAGSAFASPFKVSTCLSFKVSREKRPSAVPFKVPVTQCRAFKPVNLTFFAAFAPFFANLAVKGSCLLKPCHLVTLRPLLRALVCQRPRINKPSPI